ncbi:MAG: STAS domain-containing protein [Pseudomonadota bacterium]
MTEERTGYCQINLAPKLVSTAAEDLYAALKEHRDEMVSLDGSAVEQVGVLCMQIIAAAAKSWSDQDLAFEVVSPSPAFLESMTTLGVPPEILGVSHCGREPYGTENIGS